MTPNPKRNTSATARPHRDTLLNLFLGISALILCVAAADGSWLTHVTDSYRRKQNPYSGRRDAIAAGSRVFADHCAKCHGADALGLSDHPSLRSDRVQNATDGEISWLLRNGNLAKGMPSWSALPEPTRWQIIAYVKSLGPASAPDAPGTSLKEKTQ